MASRRGPGVAEDKRKNWGGRYQDMGRWAVGSGQVSKEYHRCYLHTQAQISATKVG